MDGHVRVSEGVRRECVAINYVFYKFRFTGDADLVDLIDMI